MMDEGPSFDDAVAAFEAGFGRPPTLVASAPGRGNIIGEHTDYNQGFVLPMALQRRTTVLAAPAASDHSTIRSTAFDAVATVDLTRPLTPFDAIDPARFANYVLGVADEFVQRGHAIPNLDVLIASDVPLGAGLSSSAALEVAFARLLADLLGLNLDPSDLARLAQRAEHAFAGTPCGIMDQLTAACAEEHHALLIDCRDEQFQPLPLPPPDQASWLIIDTGVRHELASSEYAERRATCEAAAAVLDLDSLRDATLAMLDHEHLTPTQRKRAAHVITENTRTLLAAEALRQGDLTTLGDLMFQSHDSLRDVYVVSCPELDAIVDAARGLKGRDVYGARMTGGGFGGCAIVLCATEAVDRVADSLRPHARGTAGRALRHAFP
jgi:galactokinase